MKKILITGANGFVGQNLISSLKQDYELYGIDRTVIKCLNAANSFSCDISDFDKISIIFEKVKPDILIHLAAIVHKNNADTSEKNYDFVNYECSKFLFDKCKEYDVKKIIYTSTIEVYGEVEIPLVTEETIANPKSYYAISKYKAEQYLEKLYNDSADTYSILRLCPLYGEEFTLNIDKRVYLKKDKIAYYFKNGEYSFDFCSINNLIDFVKNFCLNEVKSGIYNISDNKPESVKSIIDIYKKNNPSMKVIHLPYWICSIIISSLEHTIGKIAKKDLYLSKRNFDKLFKSTAYSNHKAQEVVDTFQWNIENTLYGDKP